MTQSILALYLSHVEASFAFDDPVITGAVFEENRVVSVTSHALTEGVIPGIDRRTAKAFAADLQCAPSTPEGVHAWIDRLTHLVPQSKTPLHVVFDPLEADSLLITFPWNNDLASAVATFGAMSPANLHLGLGESERVAFVAALTQRPDLTEATLPATLVKACLPSEKVQATLTLGDGLGESERVAFVAALTQRPDLTEATLPATLVKACLPSEKVQATLTLGDLIKGEAHNVSALTQNLRAAILGDWYDDEWMALPKDLTLTWALGEPTHLSATIYQMAHCVSVWMEQHHKACLGLTVTLQGANQSTAFKLDLTNATSDAIAKVALDALSHQTLGEAIQSVKVEHTHAVHAPQKPTPGSLAARLQSRFGERRVFMLSQQESALPNVTSHRDPVPDAHNTRPLLVRDAIEPARPVFLLKTPIELHTQHGDIYWEGAPIVGLSDPTQYRDQSFVRDYCVAHTSDGRRLWIYRQSESEPTSEHWYLHGFFA